MKHIKIVLIFTVIALLAQSSCFGYVDTYPHKEFCPNTGNFLSGDYYASTVQCYAENSDFCQCNCTAYVSWKINEQELDFNNGFDGVSWGNGSNWDDAAKKANIGVDGTPLPGDVAYWNKLGAGTAGHVAWVERVYFGDNNKPKSVDVSEYNYKNGKWSSRNILVNDPSGYIHILLYKFGVMSYVDNLEMFSGGTWDASPFSNQTSDEAILLIGQLSHYSDVTLDGVQATKSLAYFGDPGMGGGSQTASNPPISSVKPELFVKKFYFGSNGRTKYYTDENINLYSQAKNVGIDVNPDVDVTLKYFRFKGEKENGDTRVVGSDNIKGSNLGHNEVKTESVKVGVPDEEDKYQYYSCIDTRNKVLESNEKNDCSKPLSIRVHKRPDLAMIALTLNGGAESCDYESAPFVQATIENSGGEPFEDVPVVWYLDDIHYADDNMRHWNIANDDIKHEDVYLPDDLSIGIHTVKACYELEDDQDQSDSCLELSFEVLDQALRADADGNGTINTADAMLILNKSAGNDMSQTDWISSSITGDANCNGETTTTDALLVMRKANGLSMEGTAWCLEE